MAKLYIFVCYIILLIMLSSLPCRTHQEQNVEKTTWVYGGVTKFKIVERIVNLLDKLNSIPNNDWGRVPEINKLINAISTKLDYISEHISANKENRLDAVYKTLHNFFRVRVEIGEYEKQVKEIRERYERLITILRNVDGLKDEDKKSFAELNVNPGCKSISTKLTNAFFIYFGYDGDEAPPAYQISLEFQYEELNNTCPSISAQQHFYSDYLEFIILEIQGYLISKFSWTVLGNMREEDFKSQEMLYSQEYQERSLFVSRRLRKLIAHAGRELRRCDPSQWEENVNFERLTRLVQGYIVNEASLNEKHYCDKNCEYYVDRDFPECFTGDPHCYHQKGNGRILTCESDKTKDGYYVCPSDDPARRYQYIESNRGSKHDNNFYGNQISCPFNETKINSWYRGIYVCAYCFCLVDEPSDKSDRFFSLHEALSDLHENKVVTGVRFVKKNRIMHLQIQQGELAPFGFIKKNTTEWKPVGNFDLNSGENGTDYITFDNKTKSLNLDLIDTKDPSHIVTGVKLSMTGSHLFLQVLVTAYDFETGKVIMPESTSFWAFRSTDQRRVILPLKEKESEKGFKVSTHAKEKSLPTSSYYNFVDFTHSDKEDDASQTTIPFFDSQDVVSDSPTPLSGVGLYHKGTDGYGGFIAPKIFTINLLNFI